MTRLAILLLMLGSQAWATVSNPNTQCTEALGDGIHGTYAICFPFVKNDYVKVYLQDETAVPYVRTLLLYGVSAGTYNITGGDPGTNVVVVTPPSTTQRIIIVRQSALTQDVSYDENSAFPFVDHEAQMDKTIELLQEQSNQISTKIGLSSASIYAIPTLPDPSKSKLIGWDSTPANLKNYPLTDPVTNDVLLFNGSNWINYNLSNLAALPGTSLGTANQALVMNGAATALTYALISDANISSGAAIARNKLAAGTANAFVYNDASGNLSTSSLPSQAVIPSGGPLLIGNGGSGFSSIPYGSAGNYVISSGQGWSSVQVLAIGAHHTQETCSWTVAGTSFADPSVDTSCTFATDVSQVATNITSANNGTLNSNLPGVTFTSPRAQMVQVCVSGEWYTDAGATTVSYAMLLNGSAIARNSESIPTNNLAHQLSACASGNIIAGVNTVKLQLAAAANQVVLGQTSSSGTSQLTWSIRGL